MTTARQHHAWFDAHLREADAFLCDPLQMAESTPKQQQERQDWYYRGTGVHAGPAYPQPQGETVRPTKILEKARADVERYDEEARQAEFAAIHKPSDDELAAIISLLRRRRR